MSVFPATLAEVPDAASDVLADVLAAKLDAARRVSPHYLTAAEALRDFVLGGGKRVRPTFVWAGFLAGRGGDGPTDPAEALRVAAALELVQACALIHDDIIDHSDTRRGSPTVHRRFEADHRTRNWTGDAAGFGEAAAILVGDLALAWADDVLITAELPTDVRHEVGRVWGAMRTEVLGGQYLDIRGEASDDPSAEGAWLVMRYKTAAYTAERPLQLGAALAGASADLVDDLGAVGTDLGIAFQLRDDLLGVFGDPATTGKPSGDDIAEGKRTLLLAETLQRADESDARRLRSLLGRPASPADLDWARSLMRSTGAVADIESRIADLTDQALAALAETSTPAAVQSELATAARAMTRREK